MFTVRLCVLVVLTLVTSAPVGAIHRYSVGNLGVMPAFDFYRSPILVSNGWNFNWTTVEKKQRFDADTLYYITTAKQVSQSIIPIHSLEYYVIWVTIENQGQDLWNFSQVSSDITQIVQQTNFNIIPVILPAALPQYLRTNLSSPERSQCLEHSMANEYLSQFSPETTALFDRLYKSVSAALTPLIPRGRLDVVRFDGPTDYGEYGYPIGSAKDVFPMPHIHPGFWVYERDAITQFQQYMLTKYGTISALNQAWGTTFLGQSDIYYPNISKSTIQSVPIVYWADFVNWYHEAAVNNTFSLISTASKTYPILNLNMGWPTEPINYGMDITAIYKRCAQQGVWPRAPIDDVVPLVNTKRHATAYKMYKPAEFSIEAGGEEKAIGMYLFLCITSGVTWNFEYMSNVLRMPNLYRQYDALVNSDFYAIRHELPMQDTAFFFSVINHRINRTQIPDLFGDPYQGYPVLLQEVVQGIRNGMDFDVIDEFQIYDGILQKFQYNLIAWVGTTMATNSALQQILSFVTQGGVLAVLELKQIVVFETQAIWWNDTTHLPDPAHQNAISFGNGWIFDAGGDINKFLPFCVYGFRTLPLQSAVEPLPPVPALDGVYFAYYPSGILMFNSQNSVATKLVKIPNGTRVNYSSMPPGFSASVTLQPFQMILFNGTNFPQIPPPDFPAPIIIIVVVILVVVGTIVGLVVYCRKKKSAEQSKLID